MDSVSSATQGASTGSKSCWTARQCQITSVKRKWQEGLQIWTGRLILTGIYAEPSILNLNADMVKVFLQGRDRAEKAAGWGGVSISQFGTTDVQWSCMFVKFVKNTTASRHRNFHWHKKLRRCTFYLTISDGSTFKSLCNSFKCAKNPPDLMPLQNTHIMSPHLPKWLTASFDSNAGMVWHLNEWLISFSFDSFLSPFMYFCAR